MAQALDAEGIYAVEDGPITELQHGLRHIGVAGMLLAACAVFARVCVLACTFAATALAAGFRTRGTGGEGGHEPIPRP